MALDIQTYNNYTQNVCLCLCVCVHARVCVFTVCACIQIYCRDVSGFILYFLLKISLTV